MDPASLTAAQTYSPLSSGDTEARISSVPSSRMDTPGSLPVSSWPLRNHRITGLGRPDGEKKMKYVLHWYGHYLWKYSVCFYALQIANFDSQNVTLNLNISYISLIFLLILNKMLSHLLFHSFRGWVTFGWAGECYTLVCNSLLQRTIEGGLQYLNDRRHWKHING